MDINYSTMKYFAPLLLIICLSFHISQAQSPWFKLRPAKKKPTTTHTIKKNKKVSKKTSITDRYRQKKNRRRKDRLHPRNKARTRKTKD